MVSVIIRHPRTDHEVGIDSADFKRRKLAQDKDGNPVTYADAGYRIISLADGSPYEAPEPRQSEKD